MKILKVFLKNVGFSKQQEGHIYQTAAAANYGNQKNKQDVCESTAIKLQSSVNRFRGNTEKCLHESS